MLVLMGDCYTVSDEGGHLKIAVNLGRLDEAVGRDILNAFCRCFVHVDRLTSAISGAYTSRQQHGIASVAHPRDLNMMVWFSVGTLSELSLAVCDLRKALALAERHSVDFKSEPWVTLNEFEKRWRSEPYRKKRNLGAFHVDKDVIDKGLDELAKDQSVALADVGQKRVSSHLWLGYLALHNGLDLNRASYGELLDMLMADHASVPDAIQRAFVLVTTAAGVPFPVAE